MDLPPSLATVRAVPGALPACELTLLVPTAEATVVYPTHVRLSATHRHSGASASVTVPLVAGFDLVRTLSIRPLSIAGRVSS